MTLWRKLWRCFWGKPKECPLCNEQRFAERPEARAIMELEDPRG